MSPSLYPAHCRERSAESCGSSHATPASPSGRTGFSSRGSRHVLECSSAHWEPCRPSRVPGMTPAAGLAQRIGDSTSLSRLYLSKFPVSIDAGESRFGPAIFTDSLSERSRWIENPNFASSWRITASLHRKRLAHDSCGKSETSLARRFRLGGKKEGAGAAVAVMLSGIMDIEYDPDFR